MITPIRILLLLFYVACIMAVIMVIAPAQIPVSEDFSLRFYTVNDLQGEDSAKHTPEAQIAQAVAVADLTDSIVNQAAKEGSSMPKPQAEVKEQIGEVKFSIQFADTLNPVQLDHFFESLTTIFDRKELVRVVHYGDSQIEGDRISDYLRTRLQGKFGGCGVGLVPMLEKQAFRSTLQTRYAPNWKKIAIYGNEAARNKGKFGLLGATFRFTPKYDSAKNVAAKTYQTWVKFEKTKFNDTDQRSTKIEELKFLYVAPEARIMTNLKIEVAKKEQTQTNKDTTLQFMLDYAEKGEVAIKEIQTQFSKMHIGFEAQAGSDFFGVALDCKEGVAVDNVAMRGSSGVEFTKMEEAFIRYQLEQMKVKLIILQFGVNVVPNPRSNYDFYEKMFYSQLRYFKTIAPDVDILVVGVSDMARKEGTTYASYPNIRKIRDAQRNAAFKAGCAFWDLYEAMGGNNAMVSWVRHKPALASKDYTHFTAKGARLVGEMLYNALMKEYETYKVRTNKNIIQKVLN